MKFCRSTPGAFLLLAIVTLISGPGLIIALEMSTP